jgi:Ribbon-helix-helix protein, copG family
MDPMRKVQTTITMDPSLIAQMDQAAEAMDRSRSYVARLAFEEFLRSRSDGTRPPSASAPPGGSSSPMPGPPPTAAGRGLGRSPLEAPPGSIFHQETVMTADPYREMKSEDVERVRLLQQQHGARQVNNQDRCNAEVNSPASTVHDPRRGNRDEH